VAEAEESFRRAIAADPLLGEASVNLANLLASRGRRAEAVDALRRALALQPDYEPARRRLADLERGGR
jgi:tetratricopeptide (TPR) repeat protein